MSLNSTIVLEKLESMFRDQPHNRTIKLELLAEVLNVSMPALVAVLTELEHRDEIKIEISTSTTEDGTINQTGSVTLMEPPPDEV